jgi:hypothetical protein
LPGFCYAPRYIQSHLDLVRFRSNVRSGRKYRPSYPNVGHLKVYTQSIYEKQIYPWLKSGFESFKPMMNYGIVPLQPLADQKDVTLQDIKIKTPGLKY